MKAFLIPAAFAMLPFLGLDRPSVPDVTVSKDAPGLEQSGGVLRRDGAPFSGYVVEKAGSVVVSRTPYLQGKEHGLAEGFHADGSLRYERHYRFGHREGMHRSFWQNGRVQSVELWSHDLLEGEQRAYHENGAPAELRHYHDGQEDGLQRLYDKDGRVVASYTFQQGRQMEASFARSASR